MRARDLVRLTWPIGSVTHTTIKGSTSGIVADRSRKYRYLNSVVCSGSDLVPCNTCCWQPNSRQWLLFSDGYGTERSTAEIVNSES